MRWRSRSSSAGSPEPEQRTKEREEAEPSRWEFEAGDPIAPGRSVLKRLSGETRYEVYLRARIGTDATWPPSSAAGVAAGAALWVRKTSVGWAT